MKKIKPEIDEKTFRVEGFKYRENEGFLGYELVWFIDFYFDEDKIYFI